MQPFPGEPDNPDLLNIDQLGRRYEALMSQPPATAETVAFPPPNDEPTASPPPELRIIEALLFVGAMPLTAVRAGEIIRGLTPEQFRLAIDNLNREYRRQGRPYLILPQGPGYALQLRPRFHKVQQALLGGVREARLSPAAVDVLSLVAYRQPTTRQEIDSWRGADSASLLRQLIRHGLIMVVQRGAAGQREVQYGTTPRFLEVFGLQSLDDLPRTQDLQQI